MLALETPIFFFFTKNITWGIMILLFDIENATIKQTLNGACSTAQRLASSVREFTWTKISEDM